MIKPKIVLLNKDRDKPKISAFKCPTLHIQIVGHKADTNIALNIKRLNNNLKIMLKNIWLLK